MVHPRESFLLSFSESRGLDESRAASTFISPNWSILEGQRSRLFSSSDVRNWLREIVTDIFIVGEISTRRSSLNLRNYGSMGRRRAGERRPGGEAIVSERLRWPIVTLCKNVPAARRIITRFEIFSGRSAGISLEKDRIAIEERSVTGKRGWAKLKRALARSRVYFRSKVSGQVLCILCFKSEEKNQRICRECWCR